MNDRITRAVDRFVEVFGSIPFLMAQTVFIVLWVAANVTALLRHWDPYPFILLNLLFSTQAAYAAPLILLAQNRQAARDRAAAEHNYATDEEQLVLLRRILARMET